MARREAQRELDHLRQDISRMSALASRQIAAVLKAFETSDFAKAESVIEKDDLIDNLNLRVEAKSFEMATTPDLPAAEQRAARSALKVATNLEHAADCATHIAKHMRIMRREELEPRPFNFGPLATLAPRALQEAVKAYLTEDLEMAKRACQREPQLDELYVDRLMDIRRQMAAEPEDIAYYLHILAIVKYLEKIGDYVLNIGEQAIFLITGRRLKFAQFQQLDSLLGETSAESGFRPFMEGISGAVVARVGNGIPLLYKEGSRKKIAEEVLKSRQWRDIDAGLIPKVLGVVSQADRVALIREWVDGTQLSRLYFEDEDTELQRRVTTLLCQTMLNLWTRTLRPEPPPVDYVRQIQERLPEIYSSHPALRRLAAVRLRYRGGICVPLKEQLERAAALEEHLQPPFSVWLHGDFNPNNVVYNPAEKRLRFIDVHRSRSGDYLQDVTVFIVGLERDPDIVPSVRRQLRQVRAAVIEAAGQLAGEHGDDQFESRLLLGLARSYITSARIILQPAQAEWLFRQGRIAMQKALDLNEPAKKSVKAASA